ncbi:hypothetical protein AVEN_143400-1 [Araneus ventricosus]|uniref:Uncharacterized protein n=1 Tax=Araneus ventricosus TaxID=182803 RepID=A0A4Y2AFK3_ARAVE|nr:hypothetical protein AVEN_143400-1 [Araneus ventricosus]
METKSRVCLRGYIERSNFLFIIILEGGAFSRLIVQSGVPSRKLQFIFLNRVRRTLLHLINHIRKEREREEKVAAKRSMEGANLSPGLIDCRCEWRVCYWLPFGAHQFAAKVH